MIINFDNFRPGIPKEFYGAAGKSILEPMRSAISGWAVKKNYGNLFFHGQPGRGKTYAAIALMYWFEKCRIPWSEMAFQNIPEMYQEWLSSMSEYSINQEHRLKLQEKKVLVLDDIGVRKPSEAFLDYLHVLIDQRTNEGNLTTIYTTNLNSKEFNDMLGPRLVSRILKGHQIEFVGNDLRSI